MRLRALGGLANRLRAILSYRAVHGSIDVEWPTPSQVGAGDFLDVFEPIRGVTFVPCGDWTIMHGGGPVEVYSGGVKQNGVHAPSEVTGYVEHATWADCNPNAHAPSDWRLAYREVRLRPKWREMLPARPYSAMHVRRTDHAPMAKGWGVFTEDREFLEWGLNVPGDIYLATDNVRTQLKFQDDLGCRVNFPIVGDSVDGETRNTRLGQAAVDLFTCIRADRFKGSGGSSFTDTINLLRSIDAWWQE